MEIIRIPCGIHAVSRAGNRLTDRADAPTPACGHPFPKEGEGQLGPSCPMWQDSIHTLVLSSRF